MIALAIRLRDFLNDRVIYRDRSRDDPDKTLSEVDQLIEKTIDTTFMQRGFRASRHRTDLLAALAKHDYELEIDLLHCVSVARHDFDAVLKAIFRARGETRRIDVADALGRQLYQAAGLGTDFEIAISAVRYCLRIRNQYSHCNWYDDRSGRLTFVNVEEIAKGNQLVNGFGELTRRYVDLPTLESQERYFSYADALLTCANYQLRFQAGELREQIFAKLAQLSQPPFHS